MPVLDTNFLIALNAGDAKARALFDELRAGPLVVPSIVAVEFLTPFGARAMEQHERLERAFTVAHTSSAWIRAASALRLRLRKEKKKIRVADFWVAAWALLEGTYVVTRNQGDFEDMAIPSRTW